MFDEALFRDRHGLLKLFFAFFVVICCDIQIPAKK